MTDKIIPDMVDLMFELQGGTLPVAYRSALWDALLNQLPWLAEEKFVGILPLQSTINSQGILLAKRSRLIIRIPVKMAETVTTGLTGKQLDVAGSALRLGKAKTRQIQPYPTIHAHLVTGSSDEIHFVDEITEQMGKLGVTGKLICGKRVTVDNGQRTIQGYSLVLHDLKPEASLVLQYAGLGVDRQFGCGIFIPYKVITGLSED
ncbi:MAG: type I-MYXAN CRISPR-associated protein Cas6/Cmx6 [Gallionella sp.]|nr:type I-MYXAN CRISPR-associated protein Cas6/Cmx6 [Gallionella sp.]